MLNTQLRKRLRAIAHHLDPVISIGDGGVSSGVVAPPKRKPLQELNRNTQSARIRQSLHRH